MADENTVYVGGKPVMSYVLAVVTQFNTNKADEVVIKARGKAISRAVDVAEIVRNRFLPSVTIEKIATATEEVKREDGSSASISAMEITLKK